MSRESVNLIATPGGAENTLPMERRVELLEQSAKRLGLHVAPAADDAVPETRYRQLCTVCRGRGEYRMAWTLAKDGRTIGVTKKCPECQGRGLVS